jgi:hypothetical protein
MKSGTVAFFPLSPILDGMQARRNLRSAAKIPQHISGLTLLGMAWQ